MQCDICFRTGGQGDKKLHFLCPTDARNQLYDPRIQHARILLEKDALDSQITNILSNDKTTPISQRPKTSTDLNVICTEKSQAVDRTQQIITQADELRTKVEKARADLAKRKATVARRKSDLASAANGVEPRRVRQIEEVEKTIRMNKYKWDRDHATTASSRTFLCGEAAKLYGLKKLRKIGGEEEYKIGGVGIVDLRSLNKYSPAQISTALSHIVHLLMLSTHYLAIRLPAEITLPHRDYPLPTILPIVHSYKYTDVPFPGTPGQSSTPSPTASKHSETPNYPHPRPLFITKPLPLLSTEDPSGYGLFLEGVTLLAYDIAWLCKSQGLPVGGEESSFEDVCNLGKNLYSLLIGSKARPLPGSRAPSSQATPSKANRDTDSERDNKIDKQAPAMGKYSHGTAQFFLGGAVGIELIRSWKIPSPTKLADKLKGKLMTEAANNEWEMLNADSGAVEDEMGDDGVVIGAAKKEAERNRNLGMQSFMSMRTVGEAVELVGGDAERKPGTSGWTKLRG